MIKRIVFSIIILASLPINSVFAYNSQTRSIRGYVAARGYPTLEVKDEEDKLRYVPKICKYDYKGKALMMDYKSDDVIIMSAEDFQVYLNKYSALSDKWGKDNLVLEEAKQSNFQELKPDTLYVVYLKSQKDKDRVLIMESPVNLEGSESLEEYDSLLVDKDTGRIIQKEKDHNFGYCSAYYLLVSHKFY